MRIDNNKYIDYKQLLKECKREMRRIGLDYYGEFDGIDLFYSRKYTMKISEKINKESGYFERKLMINEAVFKKGLKDTINIKALIMQGLILMCRPSEEEYDAMCQMVQNAYGYEMFREYAFYDFDIVNFLADFKIYQCENCHHYILFPNLIIRSDDDEMYCYDCGSAVQYVEKRNFKLRSHPIEGYKTIEYENRMKWLKDHPEVRRKFKV